MQTEKFLNEGVSEASIGYLTSTIAMIESHNGENGDAILRLKEDFVNETFAALIASPEFAAMSGNGRREKFEQHRDLMDLLTQVEFISADHLVYVAEREKEYEKDPKSFAG